MMTARVMRLSPDIARLTSVKKGSRPMSITSADESITAGDTARFALFTDPQGTTVVSADNTSSEGWSSAVQRGELHVRPCG